MPTFGNVRYHSGRSVRFERVSLASHIILPALMKLKSKVKITHPPAPSEAFYQTESLRNGQLFEPAKGR